MSIWLGNLEESDDYLMESDDDYLPESDNDLQSKIQYCKPRKKVIVPLRIDLKNNNNLQIVEKKDNVMHDMEDIDEMVFDPFHHKVFFIRYKNKSIQIVDRENKEIITFNHEEDFVTCGFNSLKSTQDHIFIHCIATNGTVFIFHISGQSSCIFKLTKDTSKLSLIQVYCLVGRGALDYYNPEVMYYLNNYYDNESLDTISLQPFKDEIKHKCNNIFRLESRSTLFNVGKEWMGRKKCHLSCGSYYH